MKIFSYPLFSIILSFAITCLFPQTSFAAEQDDLNVLKNLKKMSLMDLGRVEVRLDDTFDVFDGLVRAKKTTVATGATQFAERAPAVTSVITAQDIEVMGARTLEEVLQSVPGLQISYIINVPIYTIRGISSIDNPEVLVLINGIRVNDSYKGSKGFYWNGFPISAISRVEVIRGPGSAVYGADAFSGVINIMTKTASEINGTEVGARIGNFNTQDTWMIHGSKHSDIEIAAMLEYSNTDGHQRTVESDAQTVFDQAFGTQASLAPGPYNSEITTYDARIDISKKQWKLRAGVHRGEDTGAGVGVGQALDPTHPVSLQRFNADLTYRNSKFTKNWDIEAQASYLQTLWEAKYQIYPPGAFGGAYPIGFLGEPTADQSDVQLNISGFYKGIDGHLIRTGLGYSNYKIYESTEVKNFGLNPFTGNLISPNEMIDVADTSAVFIPEVSRQDKYIFIQDTWTINPKWELTAGVRYDHYSDFGATTNPRLGLVWEPRTDFIAKLLYGRAFRAPAFSELYNQNNPITIGNPNLEPEEITTWELAFDYRAADNLHLALNIFHYDIENKIALTSRGNSQFGYDNSLEWKGQGFEFESRWKTSTKSSLLFNYSYQNSKNTTTNEKLSNAPEQSIFVRGDYLLGTKWYIDAQLNWLGSWNRGENDPRTKMSGYTVLDLILRRKDERTSNSNFAIGVRNIFDEDVRYPSPGPDASGIVNVPKDIPGAGRFYFVEFRYKF